MSTALYEEELMDHFKNPRNSGKLENPDFSVDDNNPSCGDRICMQGKVTNNKLSNIRFEGKGCVLSLGMASILTEALKDKDLDYILSFSRDDILKLLGISLGPVRIKCAMLPLLVLQEGVRFCK